MSAGWKDNPGTMRRPAIKVARGMHGIGRVGRDLIETVHFPASNVCSSLSGMQASETQIRTAASELKGSLDV